MKYRYYRLASKSDFHALYTIHDHGGGGGGGRIIIPSFSPARILLGSSFILRAQRFPREQVEGQVEDPSIDRSIDHTPLKDAPPLPPVQGWSERSRARTHDRYNHVGRRDLICRWRSVNWRQSRTTAPSLPPSLLSLPLARASSSGSLRPTFSSLLVFNATRKILPSGQV